MAALRSTQGRRIVDRHPILQRIASFVPRHPIARGPSRREFGVRRHRRLREWSRWDWRIERWLVDCRWRHVQWRAGRQRRKQWRHDHDRHARASSSRYRVQSAHFERAWLHRGRQFPLRVPHRSPPLIVVQGANDNTAPVADSQKLVANLVAAGADASIHLVAGAGHGFTTPATAWPDAEKAMFDWLTAKGIGK